MAGEVAIYAVPGAEQGKNRERNFFFAVFGRFYRKFSEFIVLNQIDKFAFPVISITGKMLEITGKPIGHNRESSCRNREAGRFEIILQILRKSVASTHSGPFSSLCAIFRSG